MLRSPWLWLLPILQLLLYVTLIWIGCPYRPTWIAWINPPSDEIAGQTSGMGTIGMEFIDASDVSLSEQVAQGLNFPVVVAGVLLTEPIYHFIEDPLTGAESELLGHVFTALLIPFLWYFVIKRLAVNKRYRSQISVPKKIIAIVGIVVLSLMAALILSPFLIPFDAPQIVMRILAIYWLVWGLYLLVLRLWKQPKDGTSSREQVSV